MSDRTQRVPEEKLTGNHDFLINCQQYQNETSGAHGQTKTDV